MGIQDVADEKLRRVHVDPILDDPVVKEERKRMVSSIVDTLGPDGARGEHVCPYILKCEMELPDKCTGDYRSCFIYKQNLAHDILDDVIDIQME